MKKVFFALLPILFPALLFAAGQAEGAGSASSANLAAHGQFIPSDSIMIESYIAGMKYEYEVPDSGFGLFFQGQSGAYPAEGEEYLFQIGLQAARLPFGELPPFTICFAVDNSGSMASADKIMLAIEGMKMTVGKMRPQDKVFVVTANPGAPGETPLSTGGQLSSAQQKDSLTAEIEKITCYGTTDPAELLRTAYHILERDYSGNDVTRVILLSDGTFDSGAAEALARSKSNRIRLTTIGFGLDYNTAAMGDLARAGKGSSRFIADTDDAAVHFAAEFDRMTVPEASNLIIELTFPAAAESVRTWGYRNRIEAQKITYSLPTLHHGDYETILAAARFRNPSFSGKYALAELTVRYTDLQGRSRAISAEPVYADFIQGNAPEATVTNPFVMQSKALFDLATSLIEIWELHSRAQALQSVMQSNQPPQTFARIPAAGAVDFSAEREESREFINVHYERILDITLLNLAGLTEVERELEKPLFEREKSILLNYLQTLQAYLPLTADELAAYQSGNVTRE